jgi:hypothetical protein
VLNMTDPNSKPSSRTPWLGRALRLYFRLNADATNYTPRSHRGQRSAQLMPRLRSLMEGRTHG